MATLNKCEIRTSLSGVPSLLRVIGSFERRFRVICSMLSLESGLQSPDLDLDLAPGERASADGVCCRYFYF